MAGAIRDRLGRPARLRDPLDDGEALVGIEELDGEGQLLRSFAGPSARGLYRTSTRGRLIQIDLGRCGALEPAVRAMEGVVLEREAKPTIEIVLRQWPLELHIGGELEGAPEAFEARGDAVFAG